MSSIIFWRSSALYSYSFRIYFHYSWPMRIFWYHGLRPRSTLKRCWCSGGWNKTPEDPMQKDPMDIWLFIRWLCLYEYIVSSCSTVLIVPKLIGIVKCSVEESPIQWAFFAIQEFALSYDKFSYTKFTSHIVPTSVSIQNMVLFLEYHVQLYWQRLSMLFTWWIHKNSVHCAIVHTFLWLWSHEAQVICNVSWTWQQSS